MKMCWFFAWVSNASVSRINNRGGRWQGLAVPGAAEPEPEGNRSSIVSLRNSRRNHLSATLLHSPALITNWSVIHHPQCCWGLAVVGVCVPCAHKIERLEEWWWWGVAGGICEHQYCLFFISTLFSWSPHRMWKEKKKILEKAWNRFTDRGRFHRRQVFIWGEWKSNFATKSIFWSLKQLS